MKLIFRNNDVKERSILDHVIVTVIVCCLRDSSESEWDGGLRHPLRRTEVGFAMVKGFRFSWRKRIPNVKQKRNFFTVVDASVTWCFELLKILRINDIMNISDWRGVLLHFLSSLLVPVPDESSFINNVSFTIYFLIQVQHHLEALSASVSQNPSLFDVPLSNCKQKDTKASESHGT